MATEVSTKVSLDLHPDGIKSIDGYGEDTAPVLGPTATAFDTAYLGIQSVVTARAKARTNPTWNEAQQVINTQVLADKVLAKITRTFDRTRADLDKSIAYLEGELSQPLTQQASGSFGREIRDHVKALPTDKLHKFVKDAIASGDHTTAAAILGGPAYLSGLTPEFQRTYLRLYNETREPEKAKRLKVMQGAKALIENRAGLVFRELEKAVGMRPDKVRALRQAKTDAEQAFLLQDA